MSFRSEKVPLIDSIVNKYKNSDEYAKRCLLNLKDVINIKIDDEIYLKEGILSLDYIDDKDSYIKVHITTDFIRYKKKKPYDFELFFKGIKNTPYIFIIDKLGVYWELDKNSSGKVCLYNLLYSLSEQDVLYLNCVLPNTILYETIYDSEEEDIEKCLNKDTRAFDFYISMLKEYTKFLKDSVIYVNDYNKITSSYMLDYMNIEKENINIKFEKLILFISDESYCKNLNESCTKALGEFSQYVLQSSNVFSIDYIGIECESIEYYKYVIKILSTLYSIFNKNKSKLSFKPKIYISIFFDEEYDSDTVKFYKKLRKRVESYEDLFNFNLIDKEIKELEQNV